MRVVGTVLLFALGLLIDSIESAKPKPPPRPSQSPTPSPSPPPSRSPSPIRVSSPYRTSSSRLTETSTRPPRGVRFVPMSMHSNDLFARGTSYLCKYMDYTGTYLVVDSVTGHTRWGPGEPQTFNPENFRPGDLLLRSFAGLSLEIYGVFEENGEWDGFRALPTNERKRWSTYVAQMQH